MTQGPTPEQRAQLGSVGMAAGLGCSVVVTLIVTIGGGVLLDRRFGTTIVFTLIGLALGLAGAGYELWELTKIGRSDRPPGPLGRGLANLSSRGSASAARPVDRGSERGPGSEPRADRLRQRERERERDAEADGEG